MTRLLIDRPLIFFDLETTGTDPATDRIVEVSVLRIDPDGTRETRTRRIDPERPIPPEASAVHGIRNEDLLDAPPFRRIARSLFDFFGDADLAGFNVARFDLPLLEREFRDCGLTLDLQRRRVVDVMSIFHRMEPRDLSAAVRYYLDREHDGAHSAEADVAVSAEILEAQLARYEELPQEVGKLAAWIQRVPANAVDAAGKFVWKDEEVTFSFGVHQGKTLREVAEQSPDYLQWIVGSDFPPDAQQLARRALEGEFPEKQPH